MSCSFTFNKKTFRLNASLARPIHFESLFKVDLDSMSLSDEHGRLSYPAEDGFEPPLVAGHSYTMLARCRAMISSAIGGTDEMDGIIDRLLHHTIRSILTMAGSMPNGSLLCEGLEFTYIHLPLSYRASLSQIKSSMAKAVSEADRTMSSIRGSLRGLPSHFRDLVEIVAEPKTAHGERSLKHVAKTIETDLERTQTRVKEADTLFKTVIDEIEELYTAVQTVNRRNQQQIDINKSYQAEEKTALHEQLDRQKARTGEAYSDYQAQRDRRYPHFDEAKVKSARDQYNNEVEREIALARDVDKHRLDRLALVGQQTPDLDASMAALGPIIEHLESANEHLTMVKQGWSHFVELICGVCSQIENELNTHIDLFTNYHQPLLTGYKRRLLKSTLMATGLCIRIGQCAQLYSTVSKKFMIHENGGLQDERTLSKSQLQLEMRKIDTEIKDFMLQERAEARQKIAQEIDGYAQILARILVK